MKYKWRKENANLDYIVERIEFFMKCNGFEITKIKCNDCYTILGVLRTFQGEPKTITIFLRKTKEGFEIEMKPGRFVHQLLKFSFLISLFGFGGLLLNKYRSFELYQKIEEKFWVFLQDELSKM